MSPPALPVHTAAAEGFQKEAERYQRGRPDYPEEIDGWLKRTLGLEPGKTVVDLGAGTGRFSQRLLKAGAEIVAVEPVEAMREQLQASLPGIRAVSGTAQSIPLPDGSVDAVVCAQAFHWFATPEALAEIHRVLKPGGVLGLIWNVRDERVAWVPRLAAITDELSKDTPRYGSGAWRTVFPAKGYSHLDEDTFPYVHRGPAEQVVIDRTLSVSFVAALPEQEKDAIATRMRDLIAEIPELAGKDEVEFPYVTHAYHCVKRYESRHDSSK